MSAAAVCPQCGDVLPAELHAGPYGRFRLCSREECGATVPESGEEWRARVGADLANAQARVDRLLEHLDAIDTALGLRKVDQPRALDQHLAGRT